MGGVRLVVVGLAERRVDNGASRRARRGGRVEEGASREAT
jgi:hypothetical protein